MNKTICLSVLKCHIFYIVKNLLFQHFVLHDLCRLAAAAEGRGPKIIARQEESSEEEEEDEELTPEERGRHKLLSFFCLESFPTNSFRFSVRNTWEAEVLSEKCCDMKTEINSV